MSPREVWLRLAWFLARPGIPVDVLLFVGPVAREHYDRACAERARWLS